MLETELWEDSWRGLKLFTSIKLAEEYIEHRKKKLRKSFSGTDDEFADWYRWTISERTLVEES